MNESHSTGKVWGKTNISKAKIHTIPKPQDEWIPVLRNKMGKHRQFPGFALPHRFRISRNHASPMPGNVQIPITYKCSADSHINPRLWIFEEIRKPKQSWVNLNIILWEYYRKNYLFQDNWLWLKINWVRQPSQFPMRKQVPIDFLIHENIFSQFMENRWEYPCLSHSLIWRSFSVSPNLSIWYTVWLDRF